MKKFYILLSFCLIHLMTQAQTIPAYVPTNGLVGWWPFNGNANDESGNGNNGIIHGAVLAFDRQNSSGHAYHFDGVDDYISVPNSSTLNIIGSQLTLSYWVNFQFLPTGFSFKGISKGGWDLQSGYELLFAEPINSNIGGSAGFYISNCGVDFINITSFQNQWINLTGTLNNGIAKIYLNGILMGSNPCSNNLVADLMDLQIGRREPSNAWAGYLDGDMDDIGIWNRALTPQEITALYQAPPCSLSISSQPTNQSTTTGSNTSFNVGVTATYCSNPTSYQWQTNTGFGWQTLQLAGQYTGVNTSTLHVSNVGSTNTNQLFRCLIQSGTLADTTQTATLSVVNTGNTTLSGVTHAIPYQAVVRDGAGNPLINHPLTVRCTLHDNTASGTSIYQETHTITTNNLGLFTLHIGTGVASIGNIDSIHWALYKKYLQVEFDTTAQGVSYIDLGTQQLMAVPYALYAETAGNALNAPKGDNGIDGVNGSNGVNGVNGSNGQNGVNGADGISVTSANITNDSLYLSLSNSQTLNAGKLSGGLPNGTIAGEMMYWNGTAWVSVAPTTSLPGNQSKTLRFCNGMPTWEDCPAVLPNITTDSAGSITLSSVLITGIISNDGGATITARGFCWSTSSNPTIVLNTKTINGSGIGSFTSNIDGLIPGTTYYIRAFATNSMGTSYGNEAVFTSVELLPIGISYQGGIIAYTLQPNDTGYDPTIQHGLIAAPFDQSNGAAWYNGSYVMIGSTGTMVGSGNTNTNAIVSIQGNGNYAAKLCYDLVLNGYSDWYLPSKDELNKLYLNKTAIGGFAAAYYWSSSENNNDYADIQDFGSGDQYAGNKDNTYYVRAVRAF